MKSNSSLRKLASYTGLILLGFGLAFIVSEVVLRFIYPLKSEPNYVDTIRDTVLTRARLWAPNVDVEYDIRGLYDGADNSRLRTSAQRLIEPQPAAERRPRVLFIGGSTTEALYVPEQQRWVALLDQTGDFAAYNAGQSGASSVDAYYGYLHLTQEQGMEFDLVVLLTALNDLNWQMRLEEIGRHLSTDGYHQTLQDYYEWAHESNLSLLDRCSRRSAVCQLLRRASS